MNPQALGAIISPQDYRDRVASSAALPIPTNLPPLFTSPLATPMYQRQIPACVSHSVVDLMKQYWFQKTGRWIDFSPRFLDALSSEADIPLDGGRRPRTVLKIAISRGCATNATFPNDTTLPISQYRNRTAISLAALTEAAQYAIPGYIRIPVEYIATRQAIMTYGAISALLSVGKELWTPSWSNTDINPLRTPQQVVSGHQMTPYGWTDEVYNQIQNEWSTDWADGGRNKYSSVEWSPYIHEQWAIAKIPENVSIFLKSLPAQSDFHYQWNKNLQQGDYNDDVRFLQVALMILGLLQTVTPDEFGHFGPKTSSALLAFQSEMGITPTAPNSCGPRSRTALNIKFA